MGIFDKVKNLFTDEVDEEPIKSEMIKVEIPAPTKIVQREENRVESREEVNEEKVATPIFFDDEYFKELEQPKKEVKSSYMKEPIKKEEKKVFKPTPIISPVYGVLNKNYIKEDIKDKNEHTSRHSTNTKISIDEVRKKAFGTLEDELETTLFGNNSILFNDINQVHNDEDLFEELTEENPVEINVDEDIINIVEEEMEKEDPISETELFDLIDSMYEKGE